MKKTSSSQGLKLHSTGGRESRLLHYFSEEGHFVYCNYIESILIEMGVTKYTPDEW